MCMQCSSRPFRDLFWYRLGLMLTYLRVCCRQYEAARHSRCCPSQSSSVATKSSKEPVSLLFPLFVNKSKKEKRTKQITQKYTETRKKKMLRLPTAPWWPPSYHYCYSAHFSFKGNHSQLYRSCEKINRKKQARFVRVVQTYQLYRFSLIAPFKGNDHRFYRLEKKMASFCIYRKRFRHRCAPVLSIQWYSLRSKVMSIGSFVVEKMA